MKVHQHKLSLEGQQPWIVEWSNRPFLRSLCDTCKGTRLPRASCASPHLHIMIARCSTHTKVLTLDNEGGERMLQRLHASHGACRWPWVFILIRLLIALSQQLTSHQQDGPSTWNLRWDGGGRVSAVYLHHCTTSITGAVTETNQAFCSKFKFHFVSAENRSSGNELVIHS